jgi:hypothetical protein
MNSEGHHTKPLSLFYGERDAKPTTTLNHQQFLLFRILFFNLCNCSSCYIKVSPLPRKGERALSMRVISKTGVRILKFAFVVPHNQGLFNLAHSLNKSLKYVFLNLSVKMFEEEYLWYSQIKSVQQ